jgi:hypothetical protein
MVHGLRVKVKNGYWGKGIGVLRIRYREGASVSHGNHRERQGINFFK